MNALYDAVMAALAIAQGEPVNCDDIGMATASDADLRGWADDLADRVGLDVAAFRVALEAYITERGAAFVGCVRCGCIDKLGASRLCGRCGGNLKVGDVVTFGDESEHPRMRIIELRGTAALIRHDDGRVAVYLLADLEPTQ